MLYQRCIENPINHRPACLLIMSLFFKYFASKNQLPGFYIRGTLIENGLMEVFATTANGFLLLSSFTKKLFGMASAWNFIKIEILEQVFSHEFCETSKSTFFYRAHPEETSSVLVDVCLFTMPCLQSTSGRLLLFLQMCAYLQCLVCSVLQ